MEFQNTVRMVITSLNRRPCLEVRVHRYSVPLPDLVKDQRRIVGEASRRHALRHGGVKHVQKARHEVAFLLDSKVTRFKQPPEEESLLRDSASNPNHHGQHHIPVLVSEMYGHALLRT